MAATLQQSPPMMQSAARWPAIPMNNRAPTATSAKAATL